MIHIAVCIVGGNVVLIGGVTLKLYPPLGQTDSTADFISDSELPVE